MNKLRAPILTTLGHVDHGKTTLLDCIRGTVVAQKEPGQITQLIGCSFIPATTIEKICEKLLERLKIKLTIPGLLIIDTPGHEAFTTLRKRGGSISDLAILVIDINKGFQPQTDESLNFLKQFKTPFLVAATKVDLIPGWYPQKNLCFVDSSKKQSQSVNEEVEKKVYILVSQLSERGFESERFDRITDFKKQIAIVPCSGKTGEGIAELLVMLAGLAQSFLKERLEVSQTAKGTVLEVKEVTGLGTTIDAIIYDGRVKIKDYIIIGGKKPIVTKIKTLLRPPALKELRVEKKFESVKEVSAAAGIKISAPNLENVIAGSPIVCVSDKSKIEQAKQEVQREVEEVEFSREVEGVIAKADTLGSLEALIKILKENSIPIKKAEVGQITKQDVVELEPVKEEIYRVILGFNVNIPSEVESLAKDHGVKVFLNNIIYRLIEEFQEWSDELKKMKEEEKIKKIIWPGKIKILPGFTFRQSKPAIVGVEVICGKIRQKTSLIKKDGRIVGEISQIQTEGKNVQVASKGEKVAISLPEVTVGRQIKEGEDLYVNVPKGFIKEILTNFEDKLTPEEKEVLEEIQKIKQKTLT